MIRQCAENQPKVLFIFNFITPYRKTFFEKLCTSPGYNWLLLHGKKSKEDGRPAYIGELLVPNFQIRFLESKVGSFSIRWQDQIIPIIKSFQPNLIITLGIPSILSNWVAMIWAKQHNVKTITWHCGWESQSGRRFSLPIKRWISKQFLSLADHILVYSTKGANYLAELQEGNSDNITVCYNGLEIDSLLEKEEYYRKSAQSLRIEEKVDGKKVFLYVGGMLSEKGVELLINSFAQFSEKDDIALWLVGDGPELNKFINIATARGLKNVKFWGRVIEGVDVFFAAADYFVLPGIGGLALNQALFWKLPCVVSEADGTEDDLVFDNKTGFRFTPNDEISLFLAMKKCLLMSEKERREFGEIGRDLVLTRSNVNVMVQTFIATINNLLKESRTNDEI